MPARKECARMLPPDAAVSCSNWDRHQMDVIRHQAIANQGKVHATAHSAAASPNRPCGLHRSRGCIAARSHAALHDAERPRRPREPIEPRHTITENVPSVPGFGSRVWFQCYAKGPNQKSKANYPTLSLREKGRAPAWLRCVASTMPLLLSADGQCRYQLYCGRCGGRNRPAGSSMSVHRCQSSGPGGERCLR